MERQWVAGTPKLWFRHPAGAKQCPGCHHPIIERLVCEAVDELGIGDQTILVAGVGCGTRIVAVVDLDGITTAHGRPPDVASAMKRVLHGEPILLTIQGDGDCIAIGAGSLLNAAGRAERITVLMVNNANFGTTGGQLAPTTLIGQVTTTTPEGRDASIGYPVHVPEMLAALRAVAYAARGSVHTPANYQRTKRYLKTALQKQMDDVGFSFLEILSACPPDWHMTPLQALEWIENEMMAEYPLGEFKNVDSID